MFAYIASPYTHDDPDIRLRRYIDACNFTTWVALTVKITPYSPIVHWHVIATRDGLPKDAQFWLKIDLDMLKAAKSMYVLAIDGWEESKGVQGEMIFAAKHGINIALATPSYLKNVEPPHYLITSMRTKTVKT